MEQLVQRHRIDAQHSFLLADQPFGRHVDRDLERGLGGALARSGLQHPQLAAFHGELDILHVAIMALKRIKDARQLGISLGHRLFHAQGLGACCLTCSLGQILRGADTRDNVFPLRIDQILAIIGILTGGGVTRKGHTRRRGIAHIAEHHRLHIDRSAPVARDRVQATIDLGAVRFPACKHCAHRAPQLLVHILREGFAPFGFDKALIFADQLDQVIGLQFGVEEVTAIFLGNLQCILERMMVQPQHHIGIHLDEAAIAIPRKTGIARGSCKTFHGHIVKAQVEDRIHHPRHRHPRTRTHRDEQWIGRIAKAFAGHAFDMRDALCNLIGQAIGKGLAIGVICGADLGGDRKAWGHRQANRGHAVKVRALAAEEVLVPLALVINAAAEAIHILGHALSFMAISHSPGRKCQPSIREKSATRCTASRNLASNPSLNARFAGSGSFTITPSKKASIGARNEASAAMASSNFSASIAAAALGSALSRAVRSARSSAPRSAGAAALG